MPEPIAGSDRLFLQQAEEYRRNGQTNEALRVLGAGLERNPGYLSARIAQARCLLDLGRVREAAAGLEQILERDATQLVARKLLIEGHLRQADPAKARRQLDVYTSLNPGDPEIDGLRGRIQDLLLADPVPLRTEVLVPPPKPFSELLGVPAQAPARENGRHHQSPDHDPFPELTGRRTTREYWQRFASEGLFPVDLPVFRAADAPRSESASTPVFDLDEETVVDLPRPESEPPRPVSATVTLGELYLAQGHYAEAEQIFSTVLAEEPANAAARVGLESVAALVGAPTQGVESTAMPARQGDSVHGRVRLLQRYLTALKGLGRNVS